MLFKTSKEIAVTGLFIALLIAVQYVLSAVKGIELVTVFLLCFAFSLGVIKGVICAVGFSLLRCFLFGFFPNVVILYLIYYPLFALIFGLLGAYFKKRNKERSALAYISVICLAVIFTLLFTVLDNLITAILYDYTLKVALAYFTASIPVMATHCVCALTSVAVLFYPITKSLLKLEKSLKLGVKV